MSNDILRSPALTFMLARKDQREHQYNDKNNRYSSYRIMIKIALLNHVLALLAPRLKTQHSKTIF